MKHLEPAPKPNPSASSPVARKQTSSIALVLAGLALVAGLGFGMNHLLGDSSDEMSVVEKQELVERFQRMGPVSLEPVIAADIDKALASMQLSPAQTAALKQRVTGAVATPADQPAQLFWVEIWDARAQDGDIVHVRSAGYEVDVPMLSARTRIAVPVDAQKAVVLTGVTDGGGGITLGVMTSAGVVALPVLAPGESLTLPVAL